MRSHFRTPATITTIRFIRREAEFRKFLLACEPWLLVDEGVPLPFPLEGRGLFLLEGGEAGKRWAQLEKILSWLAERGAERSQPLLVVGGGAILDLGALAASLYRRGMPLILVPTTLLGMVDATLGGKTAVDFRVEGRLLKNFAGSFYPAEEAWIFSDFLSTLPPRERISGVGEVYKTLWIKGGKEKRDSLLEFAQSGKVGLDLQKLIAACLRIKSKIVERDPLDQMRVREVLNFGHTVGHALESASGLSHGECVLWGMAIESFLLGSKVMRKETFSALEKLKLGLPPALLRDLDWEKFLSADKKIKDGKVEMSLLASPGKIAKRKYSTAQIANAIKEFAEFYRRA